jgi:hypothetical protein
MLDSITVDNIGNVIGYGLPICPLRFLSCAGGSVAGAQIYCEQICAPCGWTFACQRNCSTQILEANANKDRRRTCYLLLDFEAAASALSSSLQAALAETGLHSLDPAFAFHLAWPFFASQ